MKFIYVEAQAAARRAEEEAEHAAMKNYRDLKATQEARYEGMKQMTAWQDMLEETRHAAATRDLLKRAGDVWLMKLHACLVGWHDHSNLLIPEERDWQVKHLKEMCKFGMEMIFQRRQLDDLKIECETERASFHRAIDTMIQSMRQVDFIFPLYNTDQDELCTLFRDRLHGTAQPVIALVCGHQLHDACFSVYLHKKADEHITHVQNSAHKLIVHCVTCNRFFIMHTTMVVRRKPPTQQSLTIFRRTISLYRRLTPT